MNPSATFPNNAWKKQAPIISGLLFFVEYSAGQALNFSR